MILTITHIDCPNGGDDRGQFKAVTIESSNGTPNEAWGQAELECETCGMRITIGLDIPKEERT